MSFYRRNDHLRRDGEEPEKSADPSKARARALDALSAREMTSTQLYERLCIRFTEQAAAAAVAEMVELDYVNDDRYAETRAHGLLMARKSRRAAAQNLRQKGLNSQQAGRFSSRLIRPTSSMPCNPMNCSGFRKAMAPQPFGKHPKMRPSRPYMPMAINWDGSGEKVI